MSPRPSTDASADGSSAAKSGARQPSRRFGGTGRVWCWLRRGDAGAATTTQLILVGGVMAASLGFAELGSELRHDLELNAERIGGEGVALAPSLSLPEPEPELACERGTCRCAVAGNGGAHTLQALGVDDDTSDDDDDAPDDDTDGPDDDTDAPDDPTDDDAAACSPPLTDDELGQCTNKLRGALKRPYKPQTQAGAVKRRRPRPREGVTGEAALAEYLCAQFVAPCRGAPGDEKLEACLEQAACMHQTLAEEPLHGYFDSDPVRRARRRQDLANECQPDREVSHACSSEGELELRADRDAEAVTASSALEDEEVARLCQERQDLDRRHAAELTALDEAIASPADADARATAQKRREEILREKALSSEKLAESAAVALMTSVGYQCARGLGLSREFDVICYKTIDGQEDVVVLEAKGGSSPLKTRLGPDRSRRVQQGSPEYWLAVLADMQARQDRGAERTYPGARGAPPLTDSDILRRMPRNGNDITYVHVQARVAAGPDCTVSANEFVLNRTARERLCQQNRRKFRKGSARHDECCSPS